MTKEMLRMSKEELINAIAEANKCGKELEEHCKLLAQTRDELLIEADKLEQQVRDGVRTMNELALAVVEMRNLLKDKYGIFVM